MWFCKLLSPRNGSYTKWNNFFQNYGFAMLFTKSNVRKRCCNGMNACLCKKPQSFSQVVYCTACGTVRYPVLFQWEQRNQWKWSPAHGDVFDVSFLCLFLVLLLRDWHTVLHNTEFEFSSIQACAGFLTVENAICTTCLWFRTIFIKNSQC